MVIDEYPSADLPFVPSEIRERYSAGSAGSFLGPPAADSAADNGDDIKQLEEDEATSKGTTSALAGGKGLEWESSSSDASDGLIAQLMDFRGVPVEAFSSLVDNQQTSGISYLDPDFDIGIPSLPSPGFTQGLGTGASQGQTARGAEYQQEGPVTGAAQLKTCSDDDDLEVSKHPVM